VIFTRNWSVHFLLDDHGRSNMYRVLEAHRNMYEDTVWSSPTTTRHHRRLDYATTRGEANHGTESHVETSEDELIWTPC
jgi:hypothetical protein